MAINAIGVPGQDVQALSRDLLDRQTFENSVKVENFNDQLAANGRIHKSQLGQADFLKLITEQLKHQDPLDPMDNQNFIAQMAQFSTLEETTKINTNISNLSSSMQNSQVFQMLGQEVTYSTNGSSFDLQQGKVSSVQMENGQYSLLVNGTRINPGQVIEVLSPTRPHDE